MMDNRKSGRLSGKKSDIGRSRKTNPPLRELLKSAGYFNDRLEGYFIRNLIKKGSAFLRYSIISVKIGILLGFLFAVFFASAITYFNPVLLKKYKDILILTAYLWLIFTIIMTISAIIIGFIISSVQRMVRGAASKVNASLISAVIISVAVFSYLSVWWIKASSGAGMSKTGLRDLIALGMIFLLSLFLGKLVFIGSVAMLKRTEKDFSPAKGIHIKKKHLIIAAFMALIFFSFLFFIVGTKIIRPEKRPSSDYTIVYPKYKVCVIGIDGIDRMLLERLIKQEQLPFLAQQRNSGVMGDLKIEGRFVPPVFWTTVATGVNPTVHGIADISARRFAGVATPFQGTLGEPVLGTALMALIPASGSDPTVPITANLRRSKAFWNILNDKTLAVGIVNWWVTWPCDNMNGFEVSERFLYKLDKREKLDKDIYPEDLFEKSGLEYEKISEDFRLFFSKHFPTFFTNSLENETVKSIREAAWIDYFYANLFRRLRGKYDVFMTGLYLPGADIIQFKLLGSEVYSNLNNLKTNLDAMERYYRFLDELLSQTIAPSSENDYTVIIATQGRDIELTANNTGNNRGFYSITGPGLIKTDNPQFLTALDITPTILFLLGFPQSGDFDGKPATGLFSIETVSKLNAALIETFGDRLAGGSEQEESNFSREVLEQLRNLGYIN
jgi:hypothetical protein